MKRIEQQLIVAAQRGDESALITLYDQHKLAIYTYVFQRVGRKADAAEEIVSDVFVQMVVHLPNFRAGEKPLLAWLYTIARNRVVDYYRHLEKSNESALTGFELDQTLGPEGRVAQAIDIERVVDAMKNLTDPQRDVLILRFLNGLSVSETADLMNRNKGAIKTLTRRAIAAVQRQLNREVRYG